jgi:hypothetical protein
MINQGGSEAGVAGCGTQSSAPILQDAAGNPLQTALGGGYNAIVVVDQKGVVLLRLDLAVFPGAADAIAVAVGSALGSP